MRRLILALIALISCCSCAQVRQDNSKWKYKEGEIVHVDSIAFVVYYQPSSDDGQYLLKKVNCQSEDCKYFVLESEITK